MKNCGRINILLCKVKGMMAPIPVRWGNGKRAFSGEGKKSLIFIVY